MIIRVIVALLVVSVAVFAPVSPAVQANPGCGGGSGGGGSAPC